MAQLLLVDDEANLRATVGYNLRREGHDVVEAADGESALQLGLSRTFDAVILDLMLPGVDGFEVCRRLRQAGNVPILMLTARDAEIDRVVGLELGGDDYLVKPFSMRELVARVRALLRRSQMTTVAPVSTPQILDRSGLTIDLSRRQVRREGREVVLKPREFDLLAFLAQHLGQVFTRDQLLQQVWGYDYSGETRTVDAHVRSIRDKLDDRADEPRWLETVWGVGYRFREAAG